MEVKKYKMKDIVTFLNGRAYLMPELQEKGKYRILRVGNLSGGNDSWFYSDMELDENKYCKKGDLLYAWACSFGPHIWKEEKVIFHYHIWKLIENKDRVDKIYLYYYLLHQTPFYLGGVNGATMVHITKQNMEKKTVYIPSSLPIQQKIASILSTYDTLIENNNRRIRLLEQMAENLYKEWFVRFRFPGHEKVEMENGLPKGWKVEKLGEYANISTGKCNREDAEEDGIYPLFDRSQEIKKSNNWIKDCEAIIVPGEGTSFIPRYYKGKFNLHQRCYCIEPTIENTGFYLFYSIMLNRKYFLSVATGATVPSLRQKNFTNMKLVIADMKVIRKYNKIANIISLQIDKLAQQNTLLTRQRDLLLPRLMSGKLEVKP